MNVDLRGRDRILKTLVTGRGKVATTCPQYKTTRKALDKFIEELTATQSQLYEKSALIPENWETRAEIFLEEANWDE